MNNTISEKIHEAAFHTIFLLLFWFLLSIQKFERDFTKLILGNRKRDQEPVKQIDNIEKNFF
jgi:hypothetical protein